VGRYAGLTMNSSTYQDFRRAILERKQVICTYKGHHRELCPHILGWTRGREVVLAYQFGGESGSRRLPPRGDWHFGTRHRATQVCVELVDVDVNIPTTLRRQTITTRVTSRQSRSAN
jgi:hypothetical protein